MSSQVSVPDATAFGGRVRELLERRADLPSIFAANPGEVAEEIGRLEPADLFEGEVADEEAARAVHAGLLVYHDGDAMALERTGRMKSREAFYWAALAHRRAQDYGNSNYWWHRTQRHPIFDDLGAAAAAALEGHEGPLADFAERIARRGWDTGNFVELCRRCKENISGGAAWKPTLDEIQHIELLMLLKYCYDKALGGR